MLSISIMKTAIKRILFGCMTFSATVQLQRCAELMTKCVGAVSVTSLDLTKTLYVGLLSHCELKSFVSLFKFNRFEFIIIVIVSKTNKTVNRFLLIFFHLLKIGLI